MQFTFSVGENERHTVDYNFNKFWGGLTIKVDGEEIVKSFQAFKSSFKPEQMPFKFDVGDKEKHSVEIKTIMPLFFAGFRPCKYEVSVDGKVVNTYEGY